MLWLFMTQYWGKKVLKVDAENRIVSYSGSGRWTGVFLKLLDENGKQSFNLDTDIEITGVMPEGGRNPYLNTHNGNYPIFLGNLQAFPKIVL